MKLFEEFVSQVNERRLKVEGICILQDGREIFHHRWTTDMERNTYSHTKSFVSTAVGIAVEEGVISLEDRLVDVFPDKVPKEGNNGLEKIRLRHLLTMSSGFGKALLMNGGRRSGEGFPDYVSYMMSQPLIREPGKEFCYSTADSILIGRMLEEKLGMNLQEYLYTRVLKPLDIPYPIWECCPQGHPIGGGGMFLRLTDMAKLGQLYLDRGRWKGRRIVAETWVKEATAKQIENASPREDEKNEQPKGPWNEYGYGYQFWLSCYPDSYRADGAFGQISLVLPKNGMVIAVQCPEDGDFSAVQSLMHKTIIQLT